MSVLDIRPIREAEVGPVLEMLAPWEPAGFFERYFYSDPAFTPDHVCAAFDGARPVSCAQIVPKTIRVTGGTATVAGIVQVWTEPDYRRRGIAQDVLRACVDVMRRERFALSLLFASRFEFYGALGWQVYARQRHAVVGWPGTVPAAAIRAFEAERDLDAVRTLYDAYAGDIPGATVRGESEWRGSLCTAAFPAETFLVATDERGAPIAYMRGALDHGTYVVLEYAYEPGAFDAMAALLAAHGTHATESGGFAQMGLAHDAALRERLERDGFEINTMEDPFVMWRVIEAGALPGAYEAPHTRDAERAILETLLPPERHTYWDSDHF